MRQLLHLLIGLLFLWGTPALSQTRGSFPFDDVKKLTPLEVKIQKYKLERLRVKQIRQNWYVIRGINEKINDETLLKMLDKTERLEEQAFNQAVGNGVALGGLALVAGGGLMISDIVKFQNSTLVGIGAIVVGGAMAIAGEIWAGNIGEASSGHVIDKREAETLVKTYNQALKKELGVENVPNLD